MQINNQLPLGTQNYKSQKMAPSFKQISIVKIPKKSFSNPNNFIECSKTFANTFSEKSCSKLKSYWEAFLILLGLKKSGCDSIVFLEKPSLEIFRAQKKKLEFPQYKEWFVQNTGCNIADPISENEHSFFILTGTHKDEMMKICKGSNVFSRLTDYREEAGDKYPRDLAMQHMYSMLKLGEYIDKGLTDIIGDSKPQEFKLNNVNELTTIMTQLKD